MTSDGAPAKPRGAAPALGIGDLAPDLTLLDAAGAPTPLTAWRGRPVVLVLLRWLG